MSRKNIADFDIVGVDKNTGALVIKDIGVDCISVTNDAENVVRRLSVYGHLKPQQRLFYWDSEGTPGELVVDWTLHQGKLSCVFRTYGPATIELEDKWRDPFKE